MSVCILAGLLAATASAAVNIETVPVSNPGNAGEWSGESYGGYGPDRICGAVNYTYNIGKYEVTAGEYAEFLNAVAATDAYGLYNPSMVFDSEGCQISRAGSSGSYTYSVGPDWANRPVNYVGWGDAVRFANWLHNGQPTGLQNLTTTEDGSYFLNGATNTAALLAIQRKPDATWVIPSEDEWYKAAYHKNDGATGNYWNYPTSSDMAPKRDLGDVSGNNANYYGSPFPIDPPYHTTVVGEFENSASPYGTFDQGGNVLECNEAVISAWFRGVRGGSYRNLNSTLLASVRGYGNQTFEGHVCGFRVAQVPEPTSILMLILTSVGMLRGTRSGMRPR
jgi:formylglycine-generating enzyme required for sulfatase activity